MDVMYYDYAILLGVFCIAIGVLIATIHEIRLAPFIKNAAFFKMRDNGPDLSTPLLNLNPNLIYINQYTEFCFTEEE